MPYQTSTNQYQISKYIVDSTAGNSCYTTVQTAINAAQAAGVPATVVVRPGTYTENLVLYDGINICGTTYGVTVISGRHTPPASGSFIIQNCGLTTTTHIFNSAVAGSADIFLDQCICSVANGNIFNLTNWTGSLYVDDCEVYGPDMAVVYNTGGATIKITDSMIQGGTTYTLTSTNGNVTIENSVIGCSTYFAGTTTATIRGSLLQRTMITVGTSTVNMMDSEITTGANAAINHSSANTITLADVKINSTANPCIIGAGAGAILMGSVTFLSSSTIAGTITRSFPSRLESGEFKMDTADAGVCSAVAGVISATATTDHRVQLGNAAGGLSSAGAMNHGFLLIGSTGADPVAAAPTNGANISWTGGAGSLTARVSGTTNHSVQVGNATGSLNSVAVGATGTVLAGSTGADPAFTATPTVTSISFGGNALAYYNEGTWTPVLAFGGASTGITYALNTGSYTRIGNTLFFIARVALTSKGSSIGNATVSGLPTVAAGGDGNISFSMWHLIDLSAGSTHVGGVVTSGSSVVAMYESGDNTNLQALTDIAFANSSTFYFTGSYKV